MGRHELIELHYPENSAKLFERIAHLPWAAFLDSGYPHYRNTRYDIMAADPCSTLTTQGPITMIRSANRTQLSADDPFSLLKQQLLLNPTVPTALPFEGGALGYFAYDLGRRIETLPERAAADLRFPDMAIGLYEWAVVVDHVEQRAWLTGHYPHHVLTSLRTPVQPVHEHFMVHTELTANMDYAAYATAFGRIKRYIEDGDCYQVNLTRRFSVRVEGSPWELYCRLRQLNPAPYAAFLESPYGAVLSLSPERFLKVRDGEVETCPIKGTRPRAANAREDRALAETLQASAKDRAENVMIVDLLRNDLGKTCVTGSVRTPHMLTLESFATVHHLVSTVTGRLDENVHAIDVLRGCFPGGSITGAPKLRAMEIIEELEPHRRTVYCGAIGYVGFDGGMDTNIAIRTLVHRDAQVHFWAGGGIVADSELDAEYQEILDKAQAMLTLLKKPEVCYDVGS